MEKIRYEINAKVVFTAGKQVVGRVSGCSSPATNKNGSPFSQPVNSTWEDPKERTTTLQPAWENWWSFLWSAATWSRHGSHAKWRMSTRCRLPADGISWDTATSSFLSKKKINKIFFVYFLGGLACVCHFFAYFSHFVFLIRTQKAAGASRCAIPTPTICPIQYKT